MKGQVKEAKRLLEEFGLQTIKPMQLVQTAKQLDKSLWETLKLIAFLKSGGQGNGPFPYTARALSGNFL